IDVEVQVRGVFGVQSNRTPKVSLGIEHVAVPGHASIGNVDVERGIVARECLNPRCLKFHETIIGCVESNGRARYRSQGQASRPIYGTNSVAEIVPGNGERQRARVVSGFEEIFACGGVTIDEGERRICHETSSCEIPQFYVTFSWRIPKARQSAADHCQ